MILYRGEDDFRLSPTRIFCGFQNEQINVVFSSSPPTSPPRRNMVDGQRQKINNKRKKRRKYIINRPDGIILLFFPTFFFSTWVCSQQTTNCTNFFSTYSTKFKAGTVYDAVANIFYFNEDNFGALEKFNKNKNMFIL